MAIIKCSNSHSSIKNIIQYVTRAEKTEQKLCSGINCSPESAYTEMQSTKELYNKLGGRTYKHFIQSFAPGEAITPEAAHKIATEFAESCSLFAGFEVLVATHYDRDHIHSHIIVNSVSYEDGHKFQMSAKDLQALKDLSDSICNRYGLSICQKGKQFDGAERFAPTSFLMSKFQTILKAATGSVKSYVQDTAIAVTEGMDRATSKSDFIKIMNEKGYSVEWSDSHKYITFTDSAGHKVRDKNLQKTFNMKVSKEELSNLFKNKEKCHEQGKHSFKRRR